MTGSGRTATAERYTPLASSHEERSLTLYELDDLRQLLLSEAFFTEGELTPEMERRWDRIRGSAHDKLYKFAAFLCEEQAFAESIDVEIARLTERRRVRERAIERRKERLCQLMERFGFKQVEGPICTVTLQKNATVTVERLTDQNADPQSDLFAARPKGGFSTRTGTRAVRLNHVRIR